MRRLCEFEMIDGPRPITPADATANYFQRVHRRRRSNTTIKRRVQVEFAVDERWIAM